MNCSITWTCIGVCLNGEESWMYKFTEILSIIESTVFSRMECRTYLSLKVMSSSGWILSVSKLLLLLYIQQMCSFGSNGKRLVFVAQKVLDFTLTVICYDILYNYNGVAQCILICSCNAPNKYGGNGVGVKPSFFLTGLWFSSLNTCDLGSAFKQKFSQKILRASCSRER
ncbi:transmembrane protein 14C-like [Platysternon megacephalum]|uniref:Transmembrane protein 14C-like n=1 Tax=Platysternon megacephalum TaxID=55544 RepID=A0A4D9EGY1_9SAUR|nr:transmembrane protein 14C-like [Platysternon megacephalum]